MLASRRENPASILPAIISVNDHLHIVCLDAPSPPNYGGAIDMFYKIKALAQTGRKIILHYFDYNPQRGATGLEDDCVAIYKYKRKSFVQALPLSHPFIISSRINIDLINRLNEDDYPIFLEGLHCSGIMPHVNNQSRIVLRMHNDEAAYYHHLAKTENNFLKRLYFGLESRLLKSYQQGLNKDIKFACLSEEDIETFKNVYGFRTASFIPCFIPWQTMAIKEGKGYYSLYHGNMAVSENEDAALWLMQNIFSKTKAPLIIAGKGISKRIEKEAAGCKNVSLVNNPSIPVIDGLIREAQVNVLPSMNSTGIKLKLLNALLNGRHCITNSAGAKGSGINDSVTVCDSVGEWIKAVEMGMQSLFTREQMENRKAILNLYNNRSNAGQLNELWMHYQ